MGGKTLEQAAWELIDKPYELHTPHEHSIRDAWARERSLEADRSPRHHPAKEAPSQNDQQSDKTASDADKEAESSGSQGEGEDSG
jgi:hypothetical protein